MDPFLNDDSIDTVLEDGASPDDSSLGNCFRMEHEIKRHFVTSVQQLVKMDGEAFLERRGNLRYIPDLAFCDLQHVTSRKAPDVAVHEVFN